MVCHPERVVLNRASLNCPGPGCCTIYFTHRGESHPQESNSFSWWGIGAAFLIMGINLSVATTRQERATPQHRCSSMVPLRADGLQPSRRPRESGQ